jgi:hypothetical protein
VSLTSYQISIFFSLSQSVYSQFPSVPGDSNHFFCGQVQKTFRSSLNSSNIWLPATKATARACNYVAGFDSVADFFANDGDCSSAVYKRFGKLATRGLFYYQSELASLQSMQDQYDDIDDSKDVESLRGTSKEHREALIQECKLLGYQKPSTQTVTALSKYLRQTTSGPNTFGRTVHSLTLTGSSVGLYPVDLDSSQLRASDYVSLHQTSTEPLTDLFFFFFFFLKKKKHCACLVRRRKAQALRYQNGQTISYIPHHQPRYYSSEMIQFTVSFSTVIIAVAALLFLPIYSLYPVAHGRPG